MVIDSAHIQGCHGSSRSPWLLVVLVGWGILCGVGRIRAEDDDECSKLRALGCRCSSTVVSCENKGLEKLPSSELFPEDIKELYFKGNNLTKVGLRSERFKNLEVLDLSSNKLTSNSGIAAAVKKLSNLKELYLQQNKIKLIDASYLYGTKVEILNLSNNPVERFDFVETEVNQVKRLYMKRQNYAVFPIASLKIFGELNYLDISSNDLSALSEDAFKDNTNLVELHLENNSLTTLPEKIFDGLSNLKKVYLEGNPWNCNCSLSWLHEDMNKEDTIFQNTNNVKCSQYSSTALRDVAKEKFKSSGSHKLAKRAVPENLQFDPKKESTDKTIISGTIGPATCVQENKKSMFVSYSSQFSFTTVTDCQQECFDTGATYFNVISGNDGLNKCWCGDVNENCTCSSECSSKYNMEPGAKSTISGLQVGYSPSPVVIGTPVTVSLKWVVSYKTSELDFGDGSHATFSLAHTFQYPGIFNIRIKLCSSSGNCRKVQTPISVSSYSDAGTMPCPTAQYVNTSEAISLTATFTTAYNSEIMWTRTAEGESPVSVKCSGSGESQYDKNGHCFYVVSEIKTWRDALEHCQSSNRGSLAVVSDEEVYNFLVNLSITTDVWIGLRKFEVLDNYNWTNGELLGSFEKWETTVVKGQCVYMTTAGMWDRDSCDQEKSFLCEYTPNDIVNTKIRIAGSLEIGDTSTTASIKQPTSSTGSSFSLIYMPGLWFNMDGTIRWLTYREKCLNVDTVVKFVVYRPVCPSGKTRYEPGCGENQIYSCGDSLTCLSRPPCPGDEEVCYLSEYCSQPNKACSCAGQHEGSINCSSPLVSGVTPSYKPVGNVTVLIMKAGSRLINVSSNIEVQKGDFLGVLYQNAEIPITCAQDPNSQWAQIMNSVSGITDISENIPHTESKQSTNYVCHVNAFYSKPETKALPSYLSTLPKSGNYILQYKVISTGETRKCAVTAMDAVGDIVWVHPKLSADTIKVELNTLTSLVAKVTKGSDLVYEWTVGGVNVTNNMTLADHCPSSVDTSTPGCVTTDSSLAKAFSYVQQKFMSKSKLMLRVYNKVSSVEKTVNVMLSPCIAIQGLILCHESCNSSSGCASPCEPVVKAGSNSFFQVSYIQGGAEAKYTYFVNETEELKTQDSNFSKTFSEAGLHTVKVNMTCDTHSDTAVVKVNVKQPANAKNVKLFVANGVVVRESFDLKVTADVDDNAEVDIIVKFGDGNTKKESLVTHGGKINWVTTHKYAIENKYTVTVTVSDSFKNVSARDSLYALAAVKVNKIQVIPEYAVPNEQIKFRVSTGAADGVGKVMIAGSRLTYNWSFPDENKRVGSSSLEHQTNHSFKDPGTYNITLKLGNLASSLTEFVIVNIQVCISGLTMEYREPSKVTEKVNFTAHVSTGTNITYSLDADDGKERVNQSSPTFLVKYPRPGIYNTSLIATNDLLSCSVQANTSLTAYVVDNDTLFLLDILPHKCFKSGEGGVLTVRAVSLNLTRIEYQWEFGNESTISGIGMLNISIQYNVPKTYRITVSRKDGTEKFTKDLCIQEEITGLKISALNPIQIVPGIMTKEVINSSVKTGSDIKYKWQIENVTQHCDNVSCTINMMYDGRFSVSLNASNNVSYDTYSITIEAQFIIQNLDLKCKTCNNSKYIAVTKDVAIEASTGNATAVNYLYKFEDSYGNTNIFRYTKVGVHQVCVNASNKVSTNMTCIEIISQDEIQSFTVTSNATTVDSYLEIEKGTIVQFNVTYTKGTNVTFIWDCGDGVEVENEELGFVCHYVTSQLYNFSVTAQNKVSKESLPKKVYVIQEITSLNISYNLSQDYYAATNEVQKFIAVSNTYLQVTFYWQLKPSDSSVACETTGIQMGTDCNTISTQGVYVLELYANNSLNSRSVQKKLEAIDRITGLHIETAHTAMEVNTDALFTAKSTGSGLIYQWEITNNLQRTQNASYKSASNTFTHTFSSVGGYTVSVNASSKLEPEGKFAYKNVSIEEPITGIKITSKQQSTYVRKSAQVTFEITKSSGSGINFKWQLSGPGTSKNSESNEITHEFVSIGVYTLEVEVSNQVSSDTDTKTIYVEEVISSVNLSIDKTLIKTETSVHITAEVSPVGTYKYNWTINSEQLTVDVSTFEKGFPTAGVHVVKVLVLNNVSEVAVSKEVFAQKVVTGLDFDKCESKVAAEETKLSAVVSAGTNVSYIWTVQPPDGGNVITAVGKELTYDFDFVGLYELVLNATNNVSSQSASCSINTQRRVRISHITVRSDIKYNFVNQTIYFEVHGDNLDGSVFRWTFNDSHSNDTSVTTFQRTFESPGIYSLKVTVENEVSVDEMTKIFSINVLDCKLPRVNVVSKTPATTLRSRFLVLAVSIDTSDCRQYQSKHSWTVYNASSCSGSMGNVMDLGNHIYTEGPKLDLKARTLPTGQYCAVFTTSYLDTFVKEMVNMTLKVTSSELNAVIEGGSERLVSEDEVISINCKDSVDPDDPTAKLTCHWTCEPSELCQWSNRIGQSFLSEFKSGTYTIKLTVTDPHSDRTTSTTQTIMVVLQSVPTVSMECVSCKISNVFKVSSGVQLALQTMCSNCDGKTVLYEWKIQADGETLNLTSSQTLTGLDRPNIVITEGVIPEASSFVFTVNTKFTSSSVESYSTIQLPGNKPPSGGTCSVTPKVILNLEEPVRVSCSGWHGDTGEQLFYQVTVKGTSPGGETQTYPVYNGAYSEARLYLASLPNADHDMVSLEVSIADDLGASTTVDLGMITLSKPVLDPSSTMTDYIFNMSQSLLPALLKQNNPSLLLPYVIALSQELNQEHSVTPDEILSKEKRATIRDAITMSLIVIPVTTLEDVQQVAYLLQLLTKYFDEYQTEQCHLLIVESLKNITTVLQGYAAQGRNQKHFVPHHLLATISNLIDSVNLGVYDPDAVSEWGQYPIKTFYNNFTNLRPEISSAVEKVLVSQSPTLSGEDIRHRRTVVPSAFEIAEKIVTTILMTTMWTEKSMVINLGGIEVHGQRSKVKEIRRELEGSVFHLPPNLFEGNPGEEEEIFQILFVLSKNPFTWGYIKNLTINSRVPSLSFKFTDGRTILLKNLKESKRIKMYMFENIVQNKKAQTLENTTLIKSQYYKPMENLIYTNGTVKKLQAKLISLDVSDGADLASALHVQVRIQVVPNVTEEESGDVPKGTVDVYLGSNYIPNRNIYASFKRISTDDMAEGVDHRSYTIFVGTEDFEAENKYYLSVYNDDSRHDINISVALYFSTCQYFDTSDEMWSSAGCTVMDESITTVSVCSCNHLTSFGSSMLVPPSVIDITDLVNLDLSTNPVVIIAISIILFVYIVLVLVFHKMDHLDLKRISMIPLCGKDGNYKFEVTVVTGRGMGAGTTAHVGIKLYGQAAKGEARHLTKQGAFQRNCSDTFLIAYNSNLGSLWKILIWHDNAGLSPSWYLSHVIVKDLHHDKKYYFLGNAWLSVEMESGILKKELIPATKDDLTNFTSSFRTAASHGFADKHLWMSLMDRPDHSRFTRVQRATCAITVILFFMMVNAMWYGVFKTDSDVTRSMADYTFSWEEIITGLVSNIIVLPLALLLITLFKRSRSKENTFQQVQRPQTDLSLELPCEIQSHFGSSFRMTPHGDWGSYYMDRESTTESIPIPAKLKRTHTLMNVNHTFSHDGSIQDGSEPHKPILHSKSSVGSVMRSQQLMWSNENILKNWPEKQTAWNEDDQKSLSGTSRGGKATSATASTSSRGKRKKDKSDCLDSDDEFNKKLDEIEEDIKRKDKKRGKRLSKKSSQDTPVDGLFSSDDEWVNDGLEDAKTGKTSVGRKSINKTPARAAGATAQSRFNPREDPKLRGAKRPSFCLDDDDPSSDELERSKGKAKKTISVKDDSKKSAPERKTSTSSILKKRDSMGRAFSAGSSMKETSFMKQPSFMTAMSEKSKSNMSSIWMRNYYSDKHQMREHTSCCVLPSWCVYVAYTLCAALSAVSIIIVLLYGYNFGPEVSLKWLLSLFLAFCCSALIVEPFKVLLIAMYLAAQRKDVHEEMEKESIDILPSVQSNETIKDVKFRPLGGFALLQAQEEGHKVHRMYVMVRQFIAHMFLLSLLLAISFVHYNPHSFISSQHVELHLQKTGSAGFNLSSIKSIPDFQTWTETVLASTLHRQKLLPLEGFGVLLGVARLRQIRGSVGDCPISSPLAKFNLPSLTALPCDSNPAFSEDTATYNEEWSNIGSNISWRYHTAQELDMRSKFGQDVLYPGGGYIRTLGASYNETLAILADTFDSDWINLRTRAVFIEFTLYSPGLDLTTVGSVLVEFPISGGVLTSHSLTTQKLYRYNPAGVDPLMVCEVLFSLCVIYLVIHLVLTIREQRKKFVRSFWNWLDVIIVLLSLACICVYIVCVITATDTFDYYTAHKTEFTNFEKSAHLHDILRCLHAWLLFLFFLKIVCQLRFIKLFHVYGKTISSLLGKLAGCTLLFLLLLLTYAQLGYLYFGLASERFASFQASILTLFGVIRGSFNFWLFLTPFPVMTHFYFYSFYAFTYGLISGLVLAVMNDTYKMTRQSMYYKASLDPQDYEMIEFIIKRFKLWTGITKQKPAFRRVKFKGLPSLPSRGSTSLSSMSRRSSITSSTSSGGEPVLTEEAALYLEHQLDNAVPQWENLLTRVNKIEKLEKEEDQQMKKIEREFKNWEIKKNSPKHKPPINPTSTFQKFQLNFKGKSQMVNKMKGLVGRTSATPPTESPRKPVTEKDDRRPFSDQGERADAILDSQQRTNSEQKKRESTKNVRFSKQAW